ncbi:unnamed protein product, partial [Litomosoides sigmodontis]
VTQSGQESHAFTGIFGNLSLLGQVGDQLAGNDRVAGIAEFSHNQLGEHVQAVGGVDTGLVH